MKVFQTKIKGQELTLPEVQVEDLTFGVLTHIMS